jgi:hypothetical protein
MPHIVDERVMRGAQLWQSGSEQLVIVTFSARLHPAFAPLSEDGKD